jgi:acetolactate synthase regulatory subunit
MARIALYLDEDVHPTLARILRERGFDVLTVALAQQYAEQKRAHAGIIVSDQLPLRELLRRTLKLLAALSAEEMVNRFEWLSAYR